MNGDSSYSRSGSTPASGTTTYAKPAPISVEQSRVVARTHFDALKSWLARLDATNSSSRNNAREKLTRLTRQQFLELSTDVYDELVRRVDDAAGRPDNEPYLPVRNEFHPKRNQARQKLATLPLQRFRDLASDVYFELERRYPEFAEEDSPVSPSYSSTPVPGLAARSRDGSQSHISNNTASLLRRTPTPNSFSSNNNGNSSNDVVVPNKSTLVLEDAPSNSNSNFNNSRPRDAGALSPTYENDNNSNYDTSPKGQSALNLDRIDYTDGQRGTSGRASEASSIGTRFMANYAGSAGASDGGGRASWDKEEIQKIKSDYEYKITMMTKRITELERENENSRDALKGKANEAARSRDLETQARTQRDRFDAQSSTLQKLEAAHEALQSTHSRSLTTSNDSSRLRQDLEKANYDRSEAEDLANEMRGEVSGLVDELRNVNSRYEELLEASEREGGERREMEEEIRSWRKKYEAAKTELRNIKATSQLFVGSTLRVDSNHMPASSDGVIADVHVSAFQSSIDELLSAARSKEPSSVLTSMRIVVAAVSQIDEDVQAVDPRRIASLSDQEQDSLLSLKSKTNATLSNLLTASKNHAMSFGVSPVSLLDAAASHLSATIVDLIRILRIRRTSGSASESNGRSLEVRAQAPPPTSISAARGIPPRDSPTSNTIPLSRPSAELQERPRERGYGSPSDSERQERQERQERDNDRYRRQASPVYGGASASSSYSAPPASYEAEARDRFGGPSSLASVPPSKSATSEARAREESFQQQHGGYGGQPRGGSVLTYGSPNPSQADYGELKSYLENQTEAIVHSIQALLSAIRSGAQGGQLNENLTQIITIVSSIVAISKDALPDTSRQEGAEILRDLSENCSKLSEMQEQASQGQSQVFNKQTKQAMASASFGVAKSLKSLNALLEREQGL